MSRSTACWKCLASARAGLAQLTCNSCCRSAHEYGLMRRSSILRLQIAVHSSAFLLLHGGRHYHVSITQPAETSRNTRLRIQKSIVRLSTPNPPAFRKMLSTVLSPLHLWSSVKEQQSFESWSLSLKSHKSHSESTPFLGPKSASSNSFRQRARG